MTYDTILSFKNDLYKELYEDGLKQRSQAGSKFAPTITVLSAEFGGLIWTTFKLFDNGININDIMNGLTTHSLAACLLMASFFFAIVALVFFMMFFLGSQFSYPSPKDIKDAINEKEKLLKSKSEKEVLKDIIDDLTKSYIKMAIENYNTISKHSAYLYHCYTSMCATLVCMIINFVLMLFI